MYRSNYSTDFKANSAGENAPRLYSGKYYVVNDYKVYKCIYNGSSPANPNGTQSTVAPAVRTTIFNAQWICKWKFLYSIGTDDVIKFFTTSYIPVPAAWGVGSAGDPTNSVDVKTVAAVDGAIDTVVINNGGTGYTDNAVTGYTNAYPFV